MKPEKIGIFEFKGWPYVRYKLVSDLACVNSVELLPWERWGICERIGDGRLSEEDRILLEKTAKLLATPQAHPDRFREARGLFRTHPDLRIPGDYKPYYYELPLFE